MASARLGLVILAVAEVARATRFYQEAFGWPIVIEVGVYTEFALPEGQRLGLYQREAFARNVGDRLPALPDGQLTATELYFYPDYLTEAIRRIIGAGAVELSPLTERAWGDAAAYFADPDGNVLVLARQVPGRSME